MTRLAPNTENENAMTAAIAAAVEKALKSKAAGNGRKGKKAKGNGRGKLSEAEKAAFMAKNDADCVAAFKAKGFEDVQPRVNVLTYDKWIEQGRKVRKGEKSTKVGPFSLFYIGQTDVLAA